MVAKKGSVVRLANGKNYLVDDVKVVNGVEYIVFLDMSDKAFVIGQELMRDNKLAYTFLPHEEAIKVAKEIDKIDHKDE